MDYRIVNQRTGEELASRAHLASDPLSRMRGLLGRRGLPAGEAIILRPGSSIHTFFMRFSLDVIYVDRDGAVVKVVRDIPPFRLSSARKARDTIELQAGALDGRDIQVGDMLFYEVL